MSQRRQIGRIIAVGEKNTFFIKLNAQPSDRDTAKHYALGFDDELDEDLVSGNFMLGRVVFKDIYGNDDDEYEYEDQLLFALIPDSIVSSTPSRLIGGNVYSFS